MLRTLQRPIALILLPIFLVFSTGCTSVQRVPVAEAAPPTEERLVGITTLAGSNIEFDSDGTITRDTVYASVEGQPVMIPVDSVQRWWLRRFNSGRTLLTIIGAFAGVMVVVSAIVVATDPDWD